MNCAKSKIGIILFLRSDNEIIQVKYEEKL